jgi:RsmE family RNA methyltransferase
MNRLFLRDAGAYHAIPRTDRRCDHILRVLKKSVGDGIEAGCPDGSLGTATIEAIDGTGIRLRFRTSGMAPLPPPARILMGFPRPIQAGRVLKDLTSIGAASIWFALSELGEKSYAESTFFSKGEYEQFLVEGAEQSGNPRLPEVRTFWSLGRALDALDSLEQEKAESAAGKANCRLCLHPGSGLPSLASLSELRLPLTLALGSERGWTEREVELLKERGFALCGLGTRILKTETAALAALAIALSRLDAL